MAQVYSTLGLGGTPRTAPLYNVQAGGPPRPTTGVLSQIGLHGTMGRARAFDPKSSGVVPPRPAGLFSQLALNGTLGRPKTFTAKGSTRGIIGSISLTVTPQAGLHIGRRYGMLADLVLAVRPMSAALTFAHKTNVAGSVRTTYTPQATLKFHRFGAENQFLGQSTVTVVPFGFVRYRKFKQLLGSTTVAIRPQAVLHFTPAPQRNYHLQGSVTTRLTPNSAIAHEAHGVAYSFAGGTTVSFIPQGSVSLVRQTTFSVAGRTTVRITVQGTIIKTTGAPQHFHIDGSTTVEVTPNGSMGLVTGANEQNAIFGSSTFRVVPQSRITVTRATVIPTLPGRRGRRRLVRIFRKKHP